MTEKKGKLVTLIWEALGRKLISVPVFRNCLATFKVLCKRVRYSFCKSLFKKLCVNQDVPTSNT